MRQSSHRRRAAARGQNLVLMCLTMLLMVLLVLMTLGIATRVRDRMEAQIAADAAAYTQGVYVARTFNQTALMNRTQISLLVAFAGSESLISWSGHYRSNLGAAGRALNVLLAAYMGCCANPFCPQQTCACAAIPPTQATIARVQREQAQIASQWEGLDEAAGQQARAQFAAASDVARRQVELWRELQDHVRGQQLIGQTIALSASDDLFAPEGGDKKSKNELRVVPECDEQSGVACYAPKTVNHHMIAMMGTRGWGFVSGREGASDPMARRLKELSDEGGLQCKWSPWSGQGGFGWGWRHGMFPAGLRPTAAWAEDHGPLDAPIGMLGNACDCEFGGVGIVQRGHVRTQGDISEHVFEGSTEQTTQRHTVDANERFYPAFYDYNHLRLDDPITEDFGQPKLYSILGRDYSQPRQDGAMNGMDPWNLYFRFQFSQGGSDEQRTFDNYALGGDFQSQERAPLNHVVAPAASIVYYHRPEVWKEPPNFFNPFWRATLVAPDRDLHDYVRQTDPSYRVHAETLRDLMAKGLKGFAVRPGGN